MKKIHTEHKATVHALAYHTPKNAIISAAGAKISITDLERNKVETNTKAASSRINQIHLNSNSPNLLLAEVR